MNINKNVDVWFKKGESMSKDSGGDRSNGGGDQQVG